ncbi:PEP-CTERM sorting domain-containing protein [Massilia sp. S19_KUP03_FR1]|uniref:PEP-CTERM sorting domain-containing protein n=1 Tax=Massilia sp. S19_KUP03_FR1 TaxID=3025503 RepID=UPI002FCDB423
MKNVLTVVALAASLLGSASAMAAAVSVAAADNFEQAALGSVVGSTGGTGWASGWQSGLGGAAPTVVNPVGDMQGNQSLQFSANSNTAAYRNLNTVISGDVLVRFEFQYSGVLGGNDFLGLYFGTANTGNDGPNLGLKANCGASCAGGEDGFIRLGTNSQFLAGSAMVAGQTYVLFGHLYKTGASVTYNNFDAWLNPSDADMLSLTRPDAQARGASSVASFSTIGFRTANLDNSVTIRVDDLSISAIPEPATITLFGAALLGIAGLRRRRA